jgi:hypothetical protein
VNFRDFEEFLMNTLKSVDSGLELLVLGRKSVKRKDI